MRSTCIALVASSLLSSASLAAFNPEPASVCTPMATDGGKQFGTILARKFIGQALKHAGLSEIDLDTSGEEVTLAEKRDAILRPTEYCQKLGLCSKDTAKALRGLFTELDDLVARSGKGMRATEDAYFEIYEEGTDHRVKVEDLLSDTPPRLTARCVATVKDSTGTRQAPGSKQPTQTMPSDTPSDARRRKGAPGKEDSATIFTSGEFMVRKNITDLSVSQSDKSAFKGLDRAKFSVVADYFGKSYTYNVNGVAGYSTRTFSLGKHAEADVAAFVSYSRQSVAGAAPKNSKDIDNIGGGLLSNIRFPLLGAYHQLQIYPQYLQSRVTDGQLVSASVVYTPMPLFLERPIPLTDAFQLFLTPQGKFVSGSVIDHGRDPSFVANADFERAGGRIEALIVPTGSLMKGFSWRGSYEYQYGFRGYYRSVDRFEATVSYKFPDQQYWSIDLDYITGRNLDTLQFQQQLTLGVGFKY